MSSTFSIRVDDQLRRELARLSKRSKRPASDLAREALRRYVALEEFRRMRALLRPHAEAKGIFTDEDVFRIVS